MVELISLLDQIAKDVEFHSAIDDNDEESIRRIADDYFNKFKDIYTRIDRHRYSDVAKYIDSEVQDTVDSLKQMMKCIIECAIKNEYDQDPKNSDDYKCYLKICKLSDHIELEVARYSSIKRIELVASEHVKQEQDVLNLLADAENNVKETETRTKNLSQQLISILGIFAGIIVTFSFSTTVVGETVANLAKTDVVYLCFTICVLGLVFLNIMAFLMSFVTKLSGHSFSKTFPWLIYFGATISISALTLFFYFHMK